MPRAATPFAVESSEDHENRDLIEEFVEQAEVADTTRAKYRVHLEEFRVWLNHPRASRAADEPRARLVDVRAPDIQRFMSYLRRSDRFAGSSHAREGRVLSASSRKNYFGSLRSFYGFAVAMEITTLDPTRSIRAPRVTITPGLCLTADELQRLLDAPGGARDRIQTFLLAYTAARAGSIRELRWHDVDFHQRTLRLHGKRGKYLTIHIHPRLMSELRRWFIYQEVQAQRNPSIRDAKACPETDYVLLTRTGRRVPQTAISQQLKARATRLGLHLRDDAPDPVRSSRVSAHTLRRSIATLLLNDGHPLDAVADVLDHDRVDTTRKHYAFSGTERRRLTIEGILR